VQENNKNNLTALVAQKFIIADASADIVITMINCHQAINILKIKY
jgi:hypothetical protein